MVSTELTPQRDYEDIVRSMITSENELINHRVTWFTTMQGLLFTSLGFAWGKPIVETLRTPLCALGFLTSLVTLIVLLGSSMAMDRLYDWWNNHKPNDYDGPDVIGLAPPKGGSQKFGGWNAYPILFMFAWWYVFWFMLAN